MDRKDLLAGVYKKKVGNGNGCSETSNGGGILWIINFGLRYAAVLVSYTTTTMPALGDFNQSRNECVAFFSESWFAERRCENDWLVYCWIRRTSEYQSSFSTRIMLLYLVAFGVLYASTVRDLRAGLLFFARDLMLAGFIYLGRSQSKFKSSKFGIGVDN